MSMPLTGPRAGSVPEGITNPPIDDLLGQVSSKYALVIYAAKRARQINDYYSSSARACWSTSARWSSRARGRSRCPSRCARSRPACWSTPKASSKPCPRPGCCSWRGGRHRRLQGLRAAAAAHRVRALRAGAAHGVGAGVHRRGDVRGVVRSTRAHRRLRRRSRGAARQAGPGGRLVVVAPATADLLARAAHGRADDLLTAALLTARCPVLFAPAMHTEMWEHPATRANVALLRERGAVVLDPASGRLTGN